MDIGSILVALTVGIAPLALGVGAGYAALTMSVALLRTVIENAASGEAAPLDNVVQMPTRGRRTESDTDVRRAA